MPAMPLNDKSRPASASFTRRDLLALLTRGSLALSGLFGLGMLVRYLGFQNDPEPQTRFELGPAEDYPPGSRTPALQANAVILHEADGFTAFSLVCPHLGCVVELAEDGYTCPCHGSHFGTDGQVVRGPADQPLRTLRLETSADGRLILYTN